VQWQRKHPPESVEVRLLWHTSGRGYQDVGVAATVQFDAPQQDDTRSFKFTAPEAPYSYHGSLITLGWAAELVALPHNESARVELVIAPGGKAVEMAKSVD
jgi:hypothetical protein